MRALLVMSGMTFLLLGGCSAEAPKAELSVAPETSSSESPKDDLIFAQDGDVFDVKSGEEFSVLLDLPEGITDASVLWLPEEGGFGSHLSIVRSYRSVEGSLLYTEHQFRGAEPGQAVITLTPKNGPKAVSSERRTLTFNVE